MHDYTVRTYQGQVLSVFVQGKIRVEVALLVDVGVCGLPGGKDHQVRAGTQHGLRGEGPFLQIAPVIRQGPAGQGNRRGAAVVQLDPVGRISIAIDQASPIGGDEFVDRHGYRLIGRPHRTTGNQKEQQRQQITPDDSHSHVHSTTAGAQPSVVVPHRQ